MTDALEKIIRPIVEGQIRGFIKEHPSILKGVDWYRPRTDKAVTLTNSLTKRIVRDLTCANTSARLAAALCKDSSDAPSHSPVDGLTAAKPTRLELSLSAWVPWVKRNKKHIALLAAIFSLALAAWAGRGIP